MNQFTDGAQDDANIVALSDGTFAVTSHSSGHNGQKEALVRHFAADGTALGDEIVVNTTGTGENRNPQATEIAPGRLVITWSQDDPVGGDFDVVQRQVDLNGFTLSYTENDAASIVHSEISLIDFDDTDLEGATIQITSGYVDGEDVLAFTDQNGITGTWTSATGTLTLTGTSSVANYEAALRSITYANAADDPSTADRTVSWSVTDGDDSSFTRTSTIEVTDVNDAPTATVTNGVVAFTENGGQVSLFSGASVDTIESGQSITQIVINITSLQNGSNEQLIIDGQAIELTDLNSETTATNGYDVDVTVNGSNEGTVTIAKTGNFSEAEAESLLNGLAYNNTSDAVADGIRLVTFTSITDDGGTANGGDDTSNPALATLVNVNAVNDAPQLVGPSIVSNGDFGTGLTGWTPTGNVDHDGTQARFGQIGGGERNAFANTDDSNRRNVRCYF